MYNLLMLDRQLVTLLAEIERIKRMKYQIWAYRGNNRQTFEDFMIEQLDYQNIYLQLDRCVVKITRFWKTQGTYTH